MKKIIVDFENCYGIKALKHEFNTSRGRAFLVYASNGAMKTSFAKVFADVSTDKKPSDMIFTNRETKFSIVDENGSNVAANRIFVVEPYQEDFNSTKTATLLADQDLRRQYEDAVLSITDKTNDVLLKLGVVSKLKKNIEFEISLAFGTDPKSILSVFENIEAIISTEPDPGFGGIIYTEVFNDKVINFLSSEAVRRQLKEYLERYDELISKSIYFRKDLFDHNNATNVGKALKDNGFFAAKHTVVLTGQDSKRVEFSIQMELESAIEAEKLQILSDPELVKRFEMIDKAITHNAELKKFRSYITNHRELIPELLDIDKLRQKLWVSYAFIAGAELTSFSSTYHTAKETIKQIVERAKKQETEWREVVSIFHERFSVPFSLEVENQEDVILKNESPSLVFKYRDGPESREIGKSDLLNLLSTGEKRALYLLNIIFEIQALAKAPEDTILVLDDIADSFDYKNKYAIVEYITEILVLAIYMGDNSPEL
jgi:wobble nucleotide-excising tRNase